MDDLRHIWPELHARHAAEPLKCAVCGAPATCVGTYDNGHLEDEEVYQGPLPACDDCCGHMCEDGRCEPLAQPTVAVDAPTPCIDSLKAPEVDDDVMLAARRLHVTFCNSACAQKDEHESELAEAIQAVRESVFPRDGADTMEDWF